MKYLLFDTETTDLIKSVLRPLEKQPRVVEFYGVLINEQNETLDEVDTLVNPGIKIEKLTTEITGITQDMLDTAQPWKDVCEPIYKLIDDADYVVAHNLTYDMHLVEFESQRIGREVHWPRKLCTVEQTQWMKGYRLSLTNLHIELFGEPFPEAHRARNDVTAMRRCFVELMQREMV